MSGGPTYKYLWADGMKIKKPIPVSAPQYVQNLQEWATNKIDDPKSFPRADFDETMTTYPEDFLIMVKTIARRLFRVYVHIYYWHYQQIMKSGQDTKLNKHFKQFYTYIYEYDLIDKIELIPIQTVVDALFENEPATDETLPQFNALLRSTNTSTAESESPKAGVSETKNLKLLIEFDGIKRRCDFNASNFEELSKLIQQRLNLPGDDIIIEYWDEEFNDFVQLEDFNSLKEKARLKVKKVPQTLRRSLSNVNRENVKSMIANSKSGGNSETQLNAQQRTSSKSHLITSPSTSENPNSVQRTNSKSQILPSSSESSVQKTNTKTQNQLTPSTSGQSPNAVQKTETKTQLQPSPSTSSSSADPIPNALQRTSSKSQLVTKPSNQGNTPTTNSPNLAKSVRLNKSSSSNPNPNAAPAKEARARSQTTVDPKQALDLKKSHCSCGTLKLTSHAKFCMNCGTPY